ncbi:type II secretion system protein [bacterium]|nr:type II secretion system protein [bacterium]
MVRSRKGFSLTEILVAVAMIAVLCVPIVNSMRQSKTQTKKIGKKFMAILLARTVFEHFELYFSNKTVKFTDILGSNSVVEKNYDIITDLLDDMDMPLGSPMRSAIKTNYHNFKLKYVLQKDATPGKESEYENRFMKMMVTVSWDEANKPMNIQYSGEIIKE